MNPIQFSATYQIIPPENQQSSIQQQYQALKGDQPLWIEQSTSVDDDLALFDTQASDRGFSALMTDEGQLTVSTNYESVEKSNNVSVLTRVLQKLGFSESLIQAVATQVMMASPKEDALLIQLQDNGEAVSQTEKRSGKNDKLKGKSTVAQQSKKSLLDYSDPNAMVDEKPLLVKSVLDGDFKTFQKLLSHPDVKVNLKDDKKQSALWHAAHRGLTDFVEALLERDDILINEVNKKFDKGAGNSSPLYTASINGRLGTAQLLIAHNEINVDIRQASGWLPLSVAVSEGHTQVVKAMLESGKFHHQLHEKTPSGRTLLDEAKSNGNKQIENLLENYGLGKPERFKTENGLTRDCLRAIETADMAAFTKAVTHPKFNPKNVVNSTFPIRYAATLGKLNMVEALLRFPSVDVNQTMPWGCSALLFAAENGHYDVVERLLKVPGININQRTTSTAALKNVTVIGAAEYNRHSEVVSLLESHGARY